MRNYVAQSAASPCSASSQSLRGTCPSATRSCAVASFASETFTIYWAGTDSGPCRSQTK